MASRTSSARVCGVLDTVLTDVQVQPFITTANVLVNTYLVGEVSDADLLREIETYLAAHLVTLRDRIVKRASADGIALDYQGETGMGLDSSHYGQTAQLLDPTGALKEASNNTKITWLARAGSERTNTNYRTLLPDISEFGP